MSLFKQKGSGDVAVLVACVLCAPFILSDVLFNTTFSEPCHPWKCERVDVEKWHKDRNTTPSPQTQAMLQN